VLVDAIVTDKKGAYVHDLTQADFKVFEDNKEQQVASFSSGTDTAIQAANPQKRYLILFFDNPSMEAPDQIQARAAATKFVQGNTSPDRMMAVVEFGGTLRIAQNFTANPDTLRAAISGVKTSAVASNASPDTSTSSSLGSGFPMVTANEAEYGVRTMLLALRNLAKNLRSVPGRKMLVLFSAGFTLTPETQSELTATIDACNKANVAIYSLDVRGLVAGAPIGSIRNDAPDRRLHTPLQGDANAKLSSAHPRLVLASYSASASPDPQRPGGGGGAPAGGGGAPSGGAGGGSRGGAGGTGAGGGTGTGGTSGGKGGTTGGTGSGSAGGKGGTTGTTGTTGRGGGTPYNNNNYVNNNPYNQPRSIVPQFPPSASVNQDRKSVV
jgi:VWFA-related protein